MIDWNAVGAVAGLSLVLCTLGCLALAVRPDWHVSRTGDFVNGDRRKVHRHPVPRVGGAAVFVGVLAGCGMLSWSGEVLPILIVLCGLPAFLSGLGEDLFRCVSPRLRLAFTFLAAAVGVWCLDARVTSLALPGSDWLLAVPVVSVAFTMLVVGGFSHSMNVIDGLNGLAGLTALLISAAIASVAWAVGDETLAAVALVTGGAIVGFLPWNYPRPLLFLGDGGAYLLGFLLGELTVLLVHRNPEVSPWFGAAVVFYPVWETLFSMWRRRVLRRTGAFTADGLHLHLLVYKRLVRRRGLNARRYHAIATLAMIVLASVTIVPAVFWYRQTWVLQLVAGLFAVCYVLLYRSIVTWSVTQAIPVKALVEYAERIAHQVAPSKVVLLNGERFGARSEAVARARGSWNEAGAHSEMAGTPGPSDGALVEAHGERVGPFSSVPDRDPSATILPGLEFTEPVARSEKADTLQV